MLDDIARRIGCNESSNRSRNMQQFEGDNDFSNIIGITASKTDGLDLGVAGCTEDVQLETPTTCTPAKGRFALFAKSGTDQESLKDISDRIKSIIEKSMTLGEYVTGPIVETVYIGDRVETAPDSIYTQSEPEPPKKMQYALYGLILACLVLLCLLCMTLRSSRRRARKQLQIEDEESAFDQYNESRNRPSLDFNDEPQHINGGQNRYERDSYMHSHTQRPIGRSNSGRIRNWDDSTRPLSRESSKGSMKEMEQSNYLHAEGSSIDFSRASTNGSHDYSRASTNESTRSFPPPPPRRKSTPIIQKESSRGKLPPAKFSDIQAEDDSSDDHSSDDNSSDESSSSSSESEDTQDSPPNNEAASALSKDERRQRLEAAKARAASRRSARNIT
mmetsp:Transcript_27141/g.42624  ORF Transcript_27141/g.42624 Transcript_27141/m.42624 type:complete len:389 (+) Transcript_27141:1-1167(+)